MGRIEVGTVIGIERTRLDDPNSGIYAVDPKKREVAKPRRVQPFRIDSYDEHGNWNLSPHPGPIQELIRLDGGARA